ncbi:Pyridoxamine 5'-phosphate oxidase [uncultured archaeon]|nr:Pyridoxamine 5'-phosphate oxidase [uncultured archaeon]
MAWKDALAEGEELVLATSAKSGKPNANIVISKGFYGGKLLINNCQMSATYKNLAENPSVCLVARKGGQYYRVKGRGQIHAAGKFFEEGLKREKSHKVKAVIAVSVKEVFDLDKVVKIRLPRSETL